LELMASAGLGPEPPAGSGGRASGGGQETKPLKLKGFSLFNIPHIGANYVVYCKFELIAVQGHERSLILVPIKSAYPTSYIVYLDESPTAFEILVGRVGLLVN